MSEPIEQSALSMDEVIDRLSDLGASIMIRHPDAWGERDVAIKPEELMEYLRGPVEFFARRLGVSHAQFIAWQEEKCSVRCAARTSKGRRCKQIVTGGSHVSAVQWLKMQGEYCSVHIADH